MTKAERTRAFIIEQAAPVFNKKGYAGTSMADLTAATGLTKGAIYGNFENKDEVALAVFEHNISWIADGLRTVMEAEENAVEQIRAMVRFYRTQYEQVASRGGCPMLNTAVEADDCYPELGKRAAATLKGWHDSIVRVLERGKRHNQVQQEVDSDVFATTCIALIEGGIMMARGMNNRCFLDQALDQLEALMDAQVRR